MPGLRLWANDDSGLVTVEFGSAGASPSQEGLRVRWKLETENYISGRARFSGWKLCSGAVFGGVFPCAEDQGLQCGVGRGG